MKRYWLLLVLPVLFSVFCGLYADVILTDEQAAELDQTLNELETISLRQKQRISDLQTRNEELESHLTELEKQADERQNLLTEQETTLTEAKRSSTRQGIFSILRSILIAIASFGIGALLF